jgi:hypothetical protein
LVEGSIEVLPGGRSLGMVFRPDDLKNFAFTFSGGTDLEAKACACRNCGLVWTFTDATKLKEFVEEHCRSSK